MDLWDERWSHELVVLTAQRRPPQQGLSFVPSTLTSLALPVCGNLTRRMWGGGREHRGGRPRSWPEESWHSPAANILTSSWAHVHSLPPSGCTEGNKRFCSRFQSARERAGCFSCEHQCVYFPVSVGGKWPCEPCFENGTIRAGTLAGKVNFLRSSSAQTQAHHFRMKLRAVVSRQWCTGSSRWGLNLFSTFVWFTIKFFKKICKAMNEIAIRPERVHLLRRRVAGFSVRDLLSQRRDAQLAPEHLQLALCHLRRKCPGRQAHQVLRIRKSISKNSQRETIFVNTDFQKTEAVAQRKFISSHCHFLRTRGTF